MIKTPKTLLAAAMMGLTFGSASSALAQDDTTASEYNVEEWDVLNPPFALMANTWYSTCWATFTKCQSMAVTPAL